MTDLARAKRVADDIRSMWPDKAAEIDRAIAEFESGQRDSLKLDVSYGYRLEKFAGDYAPGKEPLEVIEGGGVL